MTIEIKSEIKIIASPESVWEQLTCFESYKDWNPFILSVKGDMKEGERIKVKIRPSGSKPMNFTPVIIKKEFCKEIRWCGNFIVKGIFDGEHYFHFIDNADGTTTLIQGEIFSGFLVPFFKNMIQVKTLEDFKLMNQKLKEILENR